MKGGTCKMSMAGLGSPYWYEWEIGLLECLNMMRDVTVKSVVLQSSDFVSLDDVVVNYNDGSIVNIQVKHTDCNDNFTYSFLSSESESLLQKLSQEWLSKKKSNNIREIRIVTNRKWGPVKSDGKCSFEDFVTKVFPILQKDYDYDGQDLSQELSVKWFKEQLVDLGEQAAEFVRILSFVKEGDLSSVNLEIGKKVAGILGTDRKEPIKRATDSLLAKLEIWSTSRRKCQEIFRNDIYEALCVKSINLPKYELYPEKPIFPSRKSFVQSFMSTIRLCDKKMYFLQGLPGSGKTNFVSYLAQLEDSIVDFRFYTYLPVNKEHPSFSDDEGFYSGDLLWGSILTQLKDKFEKIGKLYECEFPLIYSYLSVTEKREQVLKYLPIYANAIGRTCYVFIDGLDHAARANNARETFLSQLPLPEEIGDNVKIILVGQPVNDKYPKRLLRNKQIEYINLPILEESDIIILLSSHEIDVPGVDISTLAQSIVSVVGNNALNLMFAIYEVKKMSRGYTFDLIMACLQERHLNSQIDRYYEWIVSSVDRCVLLLKIEIIFAFASQKISITHIAEICDVKVEEVVFVLNQMYPLVISEGEEYYTFHNDVRLFFKDNIIRDSNFESLAISIYNMITSYESLGGYKYDILYGLSYELCNKKYLFDLFSPEYIINSIQYGVSITKIIQQFQDLTHVLADLDNLDNIVQISLAASTISQYINCAQYYDKEILFDERYSVEYITESEKYILDYHKEIDVIVYDIYTLLKKGFSSRAKKLFEEYLSKSLLDSFLKFSSDEPNHSFYERSGYVCRYFAPHILKHEDICDKRNYAFFVKGWLEASSKFVDYSETGIQATLTFRSYYPDDFDKYIVDICSEDLEYNAFNFLYESLSEHDVSISSLIELCVKGILSGYNVSNLQKKVLERRDEILTSNDFKYNKDRISCFFKMYFCVSQNSPIQLDIPQLYLEVLEKSHINPKDRGYDVALAQFSLAKREINFYYEYCSTGIKNQVQYIYETVFFSHKYGAGSCNDCNWYEIRHFLLKVLYSYYKKADIPLVSKICNGIKHLFTWENAAYVKELSNLFYIASAKDDFVEIAKHWCGSDGILWDQSYDCIEEISNDIVEILDKFGLHSQSKVIKKMVSFRLFGYVGHKDYSLNSLLDCYKLMPLNEDKLIKYGMELLTISDKADSIGDNRRSWEVAYEVFKTAVELGVPYVNALFEIKNNPNEFYNWREHLLDAYYTQLSNKEWADDEMIALYSIVNAWINVNIESSMTHYDNNTEYLYRYNRRIIEKIQCKELREKLMKLGNCSPTPDHEQDTSALIVEHKVNYKDIIEDISNRGYDYSVEQKIISTFADPHNNQSYLLINVGQAIEISDHIDFISNCVIEYIVKRRKYGYRGDGLIQLIEEYHRYFSYRDWMRLYENIVSSVSALDIDAFYNVNDDIETLCLYYINSVHPNHLEELCSRELDMHWKWLSACGLINQHPYELAIDFSINTLYDFAKYQLGSIELDS